MTDRLRVREIDDDEGRRLVRILRRDSGSVVTWRRAQMVLLSAQGMDVAAIAKVAFTSEGRVRDVIRNFNAGCYRLASTLTGHRRYPAAALTRLYHERWEHETAYLALRPHPAGRPGAPLRRPSRPAEEIWALLALYQALRRVMVTAVETLPGADPDRASFTTALETARQTLTSTTGVVPAGTDLIGRIGRAVLASLLPPRRPRVSIRRVKSLLSRYNKADPGHPRHSTKITKLGVTISKPRPPSAAPARKGCLTLAPGP